MIYGEFYKQSLRIPTREEHELVERAAPKMLRVADKYFREMMLFTVFSIGAPVVLLILRMKILWISTLIFSVIGLISVTGLIDSICYRAKLKRDVAKLCSGRYGIAVGTIFDYYEDDGKCFVSGSIGDRVRTKIEFYVDKEALREIDWGSKFLCAIANREAYVFIKSTSGKIFVNDEVLVKRERSLL